MLSLFFALLQDSKDELLFEDFYNKYNKLVFNVANQKLNNNESAEDCVQEVFIRFAKNFCKIKGELNEDRVEGLVKIAARNASIDFYRKNKKHIVNVVNADLSEFFTITEREFDFYNQMELKQAIDSLPEEIKDIFYLKYVYECSGCEIAGLLGITESLVRKRCMLGRQLVKKFIEGDNNE